ncbi:hypothetical protein BDEG_21194 [Batrachochytrium dendrobatidis JEL423]|uniref:Protein FAM72 n=1 Tax=Batrachochytrium dendrobatidis (strain JEL423) TaxID=403673 RepID=A0A177WCN1_BATDL|nr:hypothetical protein BDEG_21194 [Batrachochytrium dendrobatidis JEL423]
MQINNQSQSSVLVEQARLQESNLAYHQASQDHIRHASIVSNRSMSAHATPSRSIAGHSQHQYSPQEITALSRHYQRAVMNASAYTRSSVSPYRTGPVNTMHDSTTRRNYTLNHVSSSNAAQTPFNQSAFTFSHSHPEFQYNQHTQVLNVRQPQQNVQRRHTQNHQHAPTLSSSTHLNPYAPQPAPNHAPPVGRSRSSGTSSAASFADTHTSRAIAEDNTMLSTVGFIRSGPGTVNPSVHPQFRSKAVCKLFCRHCESLMCLRGMRAILLGNAEVELFSTDIPPNGVQLVFEDYLTQNCACRIRDAACLGCGNVVGYHVTQPCEGCLDACNNEGVQYSERFDSTGSMVLRWAALPGSESEQDKGWPVTVYEDHCR